MWYADFAPEFLVSRRDVRCARVIALPVEEAAGREASAPKVDNMEYRVRLKVAYMPQ